MTKTLVLTDNPFALATALELNAQYGGITIRQSPRGTIPDVPRLDVRTGCKELAGEYALIISIHCKQMFPVELISSIRCVNVHPGYNPFNRGWFPQVFSIINNLKAGVTIHEMDEQLDHGPIILQREYEIKPWDTSATVYENIMKIERELLLENFLLIRDACYKAVPPSEEGNINFIRDYENLKQLDLDKVGRFGDFLNHIRALTHGSYRNAYFVTKNGKRVFIRIELELEEE